MLLSNSSDIQTCILLVATVSILLYSLIFEHPEQVSLEDLIDYEALEEVSWKLFKNSN